jgi:hypothetical protein
MCWSGAAQRSAVISRPCLTISAPRSIASTARVRPRTDIRVATAEHGKTHGKTAGLNDETLNDDR